MPDKNKTKIKVLLSKLGLDIHSRGVFTVAKNLRDSGMEVVYIGNSTPEQIVKAAVQEDVDVIGVSSLGGAHIQLGRSLIEEAKKEDIFGNKAFIMGGVIPEEDIKKLTQIGYDAIFTAGAKKDEIVSSIRDIYQNKVLKV